MSPSSIFLSLSDEAGVEAVPPGKYFFCTTLTGVRMASTKMRTWRRKVSLKR